jgi:hypothetical protein
LRRSYLNAKGAEVFAKARRESPGVFCGSDQKKGTTENIVPKPSEEIHISGPQLRQLALHLVDARRGRLGRLALLASRSEDTR